MSFDPVVPLSGYAGWKFLSRTMDQQLEAHAKSPVRQRETDYFAERIGSIRTAEDLVADRRLLAVALGAFGLDGDIDYKSFIQQVLGDGTTARDALSNKLADKRYRTFSEAFGFGEGIPPRTQLAGFADEIVSAYRVRQFEIAVGEQDESLRLALTAVRDLEKLSGETMSLSTQWLTVLGNPPLRKVMETALGLPASIGAIDLDTQLGMFRGKARQAFGTDDLSEFADPERREKLVQTYLLRDQLAQGRTGFGPAQVALQLLQVAAG